MRRAIKSAGFVLLACSAVIGLAADGPEFDVASVKPAAPMTPGTGVRVGSRGGPGTSDPSQVTYENLSLKNLITTAYGVKTYQISGPGWLDTERYDIIAKMPPDTTKEQFALMLQNLLAERFRLTLHHETKDLPLYELVVAKNGPKLKPWAQDPNAPPPPVSGAPFTPPPVGKDGRPILPPGAERLTMRASATPRMTMTASKQSLPQLGALLANQLGRPVIDKTGLTGDYDYTLEFSPEGLARGMLAGLPPPPPPPAGAGGPPEAEPSGRTGRAQSDFSVARTTRAEVGIEKGPPRSAGHRPCGQDAH